MEFRTGAVSYEEDIRQQQDKATAKCYPICEATPIELGSLGRFFATDIPSFRRS